MKPIPFLDFSGMHEPLRHQLHAAALRVIDSGWYILGEEVASFESAFAAYCGIPYAIGVGNGLEALHLALRVADIGPGDEVIVPSNTYIATILAVTYTGATPVLVEPDPHTYNLDPTAVVAALSPATRAMIPVHLYGLAAAMPELMTIAKEAGLFVIEDNAQSQGAQVAGQRTGSWGHLNATSFYPGKNLGALGDAGALTTDDPDLAAACRVWRNYGSQQKYHNQVPGYNSRLDEIQAALLQVKLAELDQWNIQRQELAARYCLHLADIGDLILPFTPTGFTHVYHLFVIRTRHRDALQDALQQADIGTLIHYPIPPHRQACFAGQPWVEGDYPIADELAETMLSLPLYPGLSPADQDRVISCIHDFFA